MYANTLLCSAATIVIVYGLKYFHPIFTQNSRLVEIASVFRCLRANRKLPVDSFVLLLINSLPKILVVSAINFAMLHGQTAFTTNVCFEQSQLYSLASFIVCAIDIERKFGQFPSVFTCLPFVLQMPDEEETFLNISEKCLPN